MTVPSIKPGTEVGTSKRKDRGFEVAEKEQVELDGRKKFFKLRGVWSNWIIGWITALIAFNIVLTVLVGLGCLNFEKYQWFITAVTIETFLQIVGMGLIAVKYLFSDKK